MSIEADEVRWLRRARPLLGTLVEIGLRTDGDPRHAAFDVAFAEIRDVQGCLSRFDAHSDVARFHALRGGEYLKMRKSTRDVLTAAHDLFMATDGAFDVSLGSAPDGWRCSGGRLQKLSDAVRLDLGGIGKGYAVDRAVQALIEQGVEAGWVNAGGDLRAFGDVDVPVHLRDEAAGGVWPFASLRDGAFATSHFDRASRSQIAARAAANPVRAHVSVAAPLCLWADALTKVVAIRADTSQPLLNRYGARAWLHEPA